MVEKMAKIGVVPGRRSTQQARSGRRQGARRGAEAGVEKIMGWLKESIVAGDKDLEMAGCSRPRPGSTGRTTCSAARHRDRSGREPAAGRRLPDFGRSDAADKYSGANKYVVHFDKGRLPPVERLLVADHVRRRLLLRGQPAEPLHAQPAEQLQGESGRIARPVHAARIPGKDKEANWLPAPGGLHPDDAAVLAEGNAALDPRRPVEASAGEGGALAGAQAGRNRFLSLAFSLNSPPPGGLFSCRRRSR